MKIRAKKLDSAAVVTTWRGKLVKRNGQWWALVDMQGEAEIWTRLTSKPIEYPKLLGCYRIARYYWLAGILDKIASVILKVEGETVTQLYPKEAAKA